MSDTFQATCLENGRIDFDSPAAVTAYCRYQFAKQRVEVEIRPLKQKRNNKQNRALHAALGRWAKAKGHDVEQLKDDLLALLWGYVVRQNQFTGEITKTLVKPHTANLSVQEFCELFDMAAVKAAEEGYVMEMPDEYLKAREKARKAA